MSDKKSDTELTCKLIGKLTPMEVINVSFLSIDAINGSVSGIPSICGNLLEIPSIKCELRDV